MYRPFSALTLPEDSSSYRRERHSSTSHRVRRRALCLIVLFLGTIVVGQAQAQGRETPSPATASFGTDQVLRCEVDDRTGHVALLETRLHSTVRSWLNGAMSIDIRNESTGTRDSPGASAVEKSAVGVSVSRHSERAGCSLMERWSRTPGGLALDFELTSESQRSGYEVSIDFPILSPNLRVFTPSDRGVMSLDAYPTYRPAAYGKSAWGGQETYALPLVSVFDVTADTALTLALPSDAHIPHFQVEWFDAKLLRLRFANRAAGDGESAKIRLLVYGHHADYRSVVKTYSDDFPEYFKPGMPRGTSEGAFWYHHIQDHPDSVEMERQRVRFIWSSFWFTHLGEYLPDAQEWYPYTYADWWNLGETMSDAKIRTFIETMHARGIGTYAYFNVTEFGGAGGQSGDPEEANRILRETYADALILDEKGQAINTWKGSMAMNPGRRYSLYPSLMDQIDRHLTRLPELDGFVVDRLDWACRYDYGHDDGETMVGRRAVENMCPPVAAAVQEVCRRAHAANKRVYLNHVWRIEVARDADGYCDEYDKARVLGYLAPYRPASAWHHRKPYTDDLLQFEAQLKTRLQFAVHPHMIAHEFPISQQAADPEAADLLEIYAPLFSKLTGKEQVLLPHCVEVTGANDVNVFVNREGHYAIPVTSRTRFLSRRTGLSEPVTVTLRVPEASQLKWGQVHSSDGPPYRAAISKTGDDISIRFDRHETASMLVVGKGQEPELDVQDSRRLEVHRQRLFPTPKPEPTSPSARPNLDGITNTRVQILGTHVGEVDGAVSAYLGDQELGLMTGDVNMFPLSESWARGRVHPPELEMVAGDEGTWYWVDRAQLIAESPTDGTRVVARWLPTQGAREGARPRSVRMVLDWCTNQ